MSENKITENQAKEIIKGMNYWRDINCDKLCAGHVESLFVTKSKTIPETYKIFVENDLVFDGTISS